MARIEKPDRNFKVGKPETKNNLLWLPATDRRLTIRGLAWLRENKGYLYRLPLRAEKIVRPPVWSLGQCPASAHIGFRTDSARISARATLSNNNNFMAHMPATGSHGLSLYCGGPGQWRYWATAVPDLDRPSYERGLFECDRKMREFRIYLPLYSGLPKLEIGLDIKAKILPPSPPRMPKPIVFYGTSITQGGCANTPGSDFVSSIGRQLNLDVINLGFSGNGKGEPELAELISEINASLYVLDYVANVDVVKLKHTLPSFTRILRKHHPKTPILLLSQICYARYDCDPGTRAKLDGGRDAVINFYSQRRRAGDQNIHFADGFGLLPFGTDGAHVDGAHPTSHGFQIMTDRLAPQIAQILLRNT